MAVVGRTRGIDKSGSRRGRKEANITSTFQLCPHTTMTRLSALSLVLSITMLVLFSSHAYAKHHTTQHHAEMRQISFGKHSSTSPVALESKFPVPPPVAEPDPYAQERQRHDLPTWLGNGYTNGMARTISVEQEKALRAVLDERNRRRTIT